jgi:DNA-binding transcriptional regulator YhcF (GntR family)
LLSDLLCAAFVGQDGRVPIVIDNASSIPPFEQVRAQLAQQINDGALPVGAKLPTVRALAAELGLATNTVARAYRELESASLLQTRGRAGTFIGADGDAGKAKVSAAAAEFVAVVDGLGIDRAVALAIVTAALQADR